MSVALANQNHLMRSKKSVYQADQQIKLLHLEADVESLLQQLQYLKQQRLTSDTQEVASYDENLN
ncbi:hypothetical protein [Argonema antarcticum]|uniref:hypothetical protein n=1 Tax=Argonema antarcticum TaxID=2942763 RepID=UPI002012EDB3|nr:hypothetical protein [Argonema antarcticum]MCL1469700.1 hypothetical protein [Argonema antarcticum A004/B2]